MPAPKCVHVVNILCSGIGKETARDLAERGAKVILACRDLEKGKKACGRHSRLFQSDGIYLLYYILPVPEYCNFDTSGRFKFSGV